MFSPIGPGFGSYLLSTRSSKSARACAAHGAATVRPAFSNGEPRITEPRHSVVETVVILTSLARARAVVIRREGLDRRWFASASASASATTML